MEKNISCPFCQLEIQASNEICPNCENEMPWMSHIYKRENSVFRAVRNFLFDIISSLTKRKRPDKDKVLGLVNALMIGRVALVLGSLLGTTLIVVEILALKQQNQIMEQQTILMRSQDQLMSIQNMNSEFDQYTKIRDFLSDTTYFKAQPTKKGKIPTSSPHAINFIVRLADARSKIYGPILDFLLKDQNQTVRSGALICLLKMKNYKSTLNRIQIDHIDFGKHKLIFDNQKVNHLTFLDCHINLLQIENNSIQRLAFIESQIVSLTLINVVLNSFGSQNSSVGIINLCYSILRSLSFTSDQNEKNHFLVFTLMSSYIETFQNGNKEYYNKSLNRYRQFSEDQSLDYFIESIRLNDAINNAITEEEQVKLEQEEKQHITEYIQFVNGKRSQLGYRPVDRAILKYK